MSTDRENGNPTRSDGDRFDERLRAALLLEAKRSGVGVDLRRLRGAADAPPETWRPPTWWRAAAAAAAAAGLLTAVLLLPSRPQPPAALENAGVPSASPTAFGLPGKRTAGPPPITLADCQIVPENAGLAFSGWATTNVLHVSGGSAAPGQPVYALVTRGLAEWVGWRSEDTTPMYPAPVARMGCIYDPSSGTVSQVGVAMDWQPPATIDGCPASPQDEFGGYREVGGPRAWVLLPTGASGWVSGRTATIIYRLSPSRRGGRGPLGAGDPADRRRGLRARLRGGCGDERSRRHCDARGAPPARARHSTTSWISGSRHRAAGCSRWPRTVSWPGPRSCTSERLDRPAAGGVQPRG